MFKSFAEPNKSDSDSDEKSPPKTQGLSLKSLTQKAISNPEFLKFEKYQKELLKKRGPIRRSSDTFFSRQKKLKFKQSKIQKKAEEMLRKVKGVLTITIVKRQTEAARSHYGSARSL